MGLSYSEVADILKIIDGSSCDEVILEQGGVKLVIRRGAQTQTNPSVSAAASAATKSTALGIPQTANQVPTASELQGNTICAPIVGTFYGSPSPDAPAFVQVGSHISAGQTLCIVEAMKLMNEIESDVSGTIVSILANNAQPVEYNQPLFIVKPD